MIKQYLGYEWGKDISSLRIPGVKGEGIKMAWEVGAASTDMTMELIYMMPGEFDPFFGHGGEIKARILFGENLDKIMNELNEVLV